MKTALVLTIRSDSWLIPGATPTDAGKLLGLLGKAVRVCYDYERENNQEIWRVKDDSDFPGYNQANAKVEMVPLSRVRMPKPSQDEPALARKAKPVQGISASPVLRLEGGSK